MDANRRFAELAISPQDQAKFDYFRSIATGQMVNERGYHKFRIRGHHRADNNGYVRTSILMAEAALRKPLPDGALVHHVNEDKMDNRSCNLVVCENDAYHMLLHMRRRAFIATGNPHKRVCVYCHEYDDTANMIQKKNKNHYYHRDCMRLYNSQREGRKGCPAIRTNDLPL